MGSGGRWGVMIARSKGSGPKPGNDGSPVSPTCTDTGNLLPAAFLTFETAMRGE